MGSMQIAEILSDPRELELLRIHLTEVHVGMRTIEKITRYDKEASEFLTAERIRRFDIDKAARQLVIKFMAFGHKADELEELIMFGYRCEVAIRRGWPMPPEIPSRNNIPRSSDRERKQNNGEPKNDTNKDGPPEK